ncbi:DUF664 domain-containing protein [Glycomyces sp. YM15]|uniref:mycothiol transferase n=1 Tax=Glycomyces sp. YM15 TaxID=2800446 RepID=UPI0019659A41|nr:DUF664 domain-containing protein [Glycomyces sp. YM15]
MATRPCAQRAVRPLGRDRRRPAARGAGTRAPPGGEPCSLRWILLHMIEETARHNGRLDIIREPADGTTGE